MCSIESCIKVVPKQPLVVAPHQRAPNPQTILKKSSREALDAECYLIYSPMIFTKLIDKVIKIGRVGLHGRAQAHADSYIHEQRSRS